MRFDVFRGFATVCLIASMATVSFADNLVQTASQAKGFKTLVAALQAADLTDALGGKGPFTVFAPNDEAFAKLPAGTVAELLKPENKDRLVSILKYHVVEGAVEAEQAIKVDSATTLEGQRVAIESKLGRLSINESNVIATNIRCDNGIIHVIDQVLIPSEKDIPTIATENGTFKTLVAALGAAELVETLSGPGPFTVFAPTDEAFAKLPSGTVESLLKSENRDQLVSILTYHVVPGRVYSDAVLDAGAANTVQGQGVSFALSPEGLRVNESKIVAADLQASNGVIHVIDEVLMPTFLDSAGAKNLLEETVSRGARAFNKGDFHACSDLYLRSCSQIVEQGQSLPMEVGSVLKISLKRAKGIKNEEERAWVLRHGIDLAYFALGH
ncbi:MAG: fasciclin domain-containing protein [Planctomycetota bacterium]